MNSKRMDNKFIDTPKNKAFFSEEFNYVFDKRDGHTAMWGKTYEDDPDVAPFNVILDFEITERCSGIGDYGPCKFCYKSNTPNQGYVTSFEEARRIIDKLPRQCTQIAFGTDAKLQSNPDWYKIFTYARDSGFIPNVTVADITNETAEKLASVCGAVAVSRYADKNYCYDSVKRLTDCGMKQVNIHQLVSVETLDQIYETIDDIKNDPRLAKLNAIVFLSLKRKGRGENFHSVSQEQFNDIVNKCFELGIGFGFDSCSCKKFTNAIKDRPDGKKLMMYSEPCESTLFSFYINAKGEGFPCSFTEGTAGWETGIDVANCNDFISDVWNNYRIQNFREMLLMNNRSCPIYNI